MKPSQILTVTFAICLSTMGFAQSKITIKTDSIEGCNPTVVKFSYTTDINPVVSTHWDFGNNVFSNDEHPKTSYNLAGNYNVELIINGQDTGRITIPITNSISAPNVFSPNGDNLNDYFEIKYDDKTTLNLKVFTRSGTLIYNTTALKISWDGFLDSGDKILQGMYFFIVETIGATPAVKKNGFVYVYY